MSLGYELIEVGQKFTISVREKANTDSKNFIMISNQLQLLSENYIAASETREWQVKGDRIGIYYISLIYANPNSNDLPKVNLVKVEILEEGQIIDFIIYVMQNRITGYVMKSKFYNVNGIETETLMGTTYSIRVIRDKDRNVYNFYLEDGEIVYEAHTCVYSARNSFRKRCNVNVGTLQKLGTIELPVSSPVSSKNLLKLQMVGDSIVAYEYKGKYTQRESITGPVMVKEVSLPIIVEPVTLQLYKWKGDFVYLLIPPCCGRHNCLFDFNGKKIGCPSGGESGKGDGMEFMGGVLLGDIQIRD
jgi:hypothetical protein